MSLTLLDLSLIAQFGFNAHLPWWIWALGILDAITSGNSLNRIAKALER